MEFIEDCIQVLQDDGDFQRLRAENIYLGLVGKEVRNQVIGELLQSVYLF